jgi:hypothetical protein
VTFWIISGNATTTVVMATNRHLRRWKNALVGSLAISDLCVGINHTVYMVLYYLSRPTHQWNTGLVLLITNFSISLLHIIAIGLDRFIAIVKPLHYRSLVTPRVTLLMIVICWSLPSATICPMYVVVLKDSHITDGLYFGDRVHFVTIIISYISISITMTLFYGTIFNVARAQADKDRQFRLTISNQESNPVINNDGSGNTRSSTDGAVRLKTPIGTCGKGSKLVLAIQLSYLVMCLPITIHAMLMIAGVKPSLSMVFFEMIGQHLALSNSAINVFLYAIVITDFRKAFKSTFCSCKQCHVHH